MARIDPSAPSLRAAAAAAALLLAAGCREQAPEWPQFRGPGGLGISDAGALPATWSAGSANIRWRTPVPGRGNSSPVVAGDRVFLTAAVERPAAAGAEAHFERSVLALDLATGKLLWQTGIFTAPRDRGHRLNTNAAPTPVTDGESVYVYFGSHLARLTRDGQVVWAKEIDPTYREHIRYGAASSPILAGETVIVVQDREDGESEDPGWMAAHDRENGGQVWRREWRDTCCSYSTPLLWRRPGGEEELVFAYSGAVAAHDPRTGERLWEHLHPMWQYVGGPAVEGDVLCALGGAHHKKGNLCVRVTGKGKGAEVERLWYVRKQAPETSSPVLYRGRVYAVTEGGILSCYDPATGKVHWAERLEAGKGYRASLVAGDGKVYAHSTRNVTAVIDASTDAFRVLAYNDLGDGGNNATPAIAGGCLLLRTAEHLYCIEKEAGTGV